MTLIVSYGGFFLCCYSIYQNAYNIKVIVFINNIFFERDEKEMKMAVKIACLIMAVVAVLGGLGFWFGTLINDAINDKHDVYTNAIQAETEEEFVKAIQNKQNVIASDKLVANELVTHKNLDGEYALIRISHYQKVTKTRIVTYTEGGKTKTRSEIYYDWNFMGSELIHGDSFSFMGYTFAYEEVDLPDRHVKEYDMNGFEQDTYYVVDNNAAGTMMVSFDDNGEMKTEFYENMSIEEAISSSNSNVGLIVFIIFWSIGVLLLCWWLGYKAYWDWF